MQNLAQRRAAAAQRIHPEASARLAELHREEEGRVLPTLDPGTPLVNAFAQQLAVWGVEEAFGVSGGAIALLFDAIVDSPIRLRHFRHETGAAFAATEAHFASGRPTAVFATTGPGLLNALTGVTAAKWEGAKLVMVSGHTNSPQRGRWASQETSSYTMPQDALYGQGALFDYAIRLEHASELPEVMRRLATGLARPGGFVAHVCLPMSVQSSRIEACRLQPLGRTTAPAVGARDLADCVRMLKSAPFAIWAGFGATGAASQVRELADRTGAKIFCSPRAKGVVSEKHPQFLGVTGLGGHEAVIAHMIQEKPTYLLVLGTRLGEATSFWDRDMLPSEALIHVDLDPEVPGTAFPDFPTLAVQAEIGNFLEQLLEHFPAAAAPRRGGGSKVLPFDDGAARVTGRGPVRPQVLMDALQRQVVDKSDAVVLSECGNAFAWCNHHLCFEDPARYRVSTLFGSMGHTAAGVVGAALASGRKAVAVVGDGSMLMNSEVSSAAQYRAKAVWVVLNDAGYGMCRDGHRTLGLTESEVSFPEVDFVEWARSMGADGTRVDTEDLLDVALEDAMRAEGPFVVDVHIDPSEASPLLKRFESLIQQGNSKNVAGWER
ncbi:MAG: thiamine pyrophosphate-dependent enzyme [Acidobacteriota bacterium]